MEFLVVSLLNGVIHGLLLFMVSAGLTLIFGMMGVLNFAHAWFYMLGAYVGFTLTRTVGFWPGLIAAPIIVGALRRADRALHAAPRASIRPHPRAAPDLRPRLHHRGGDQALLRRLPGELRHAALHEVRGVHPVRDELPVLPSVHGRSRHRHVRRALSAADPHPGRLDRAGRHLPAEHGRGARPQPASRLHERVRRRCRPRRAGRRRCRRVLPDRAQHGGRFRDAGVRRGRGRRARFARGRAARFAA